MHTVLTWLEYVGEVCSHAAAALSLLKVNTLIKRQFSTTSLPCSWLPANFKFVSFSKVADIDFKTPSQNKKRLLEMNPALVSQRESHLRLCHLQTVI